MKAKYLTVAILVLLAITSASVATAQFDDGNEFGDGDEFDDSDDDFEVEEEENKADTVYVREDGSGVLVYNSSETEENATVSFGFDAQQGLFHFVGDGEYEDERGLIGNLSVEAEPGSWLVDGSFEADEVEFGENIDVDITSQTDETTSELDAFASMRIPIIAFFDPQADTEGEVVVGPDSLRSSGSMSYGIPQGFGGQGIGEGEEDETRRKVFRFNLSETGDGYLIEERRRTVLREEPTLGNFSFGDDEFGSDEFGSDESENEGFASDEEENFSEGFGDTEGFDTSDPVGDWGTRDDALGTLQDIYGISSVDGDVTVDINSYSFENVTTSEEFGPTTNEYLLDIDYSVEYPGLKDEMADAFAENLSEDDELSQETADELSEAVRNLKINSVSYSLDYDSTGGEFDWNLDVENYNDALTAFLDIFSEIEPDEFDGNETGLESEDEIPPSYYEDIINTTIGQWKANVEAAESSGYVSRWEWSGDLESGVASANLTHETENWEAYVDELEERDVPVPPETSFDLTASSTESGVEGDLRWEVGGKGLRQRYDQTFDYYRTFFEASEEFNASVFDNLENSEFRVAKMDASVEQGSWNFETGAKFDNSTAVSSLIREGTGLSVREVVGTEEDGVVTTYVKVDELVDEPTEDSVRSLDQVDEETEVRLPGDWNRDFPEMDTESAKEYLGVDQGPSLLLILGIVALVVAVLVVAAVAFRRRREE